MFFSISYHWQSIEYRTTPGQSSSSPFLYLAILSSCGFILCHSEISQCKDIYFYSSNTVSMKLKFYCISIPEREIKGNHEGIWLLTPLVLNLRAGALYFSFKTVLPIQNSTIVEEQSSEEVENTGGILSFSHGTHVWFLKS